MSESGDGIGDAERDVGGIAARRACDCGIQDEINLPEITEQGGAKRIGVGRQRRGRPPEEPARIGQRNAQSYLAGVRDVEKAEGMARLRMERIRASAGARTLLVDAFEVAQEEIDGSPGGPIRVSVPDPCDATSPSRVRSASST